VGKILGQVEVKKKDTEEEKKKKEGERENKEKEGEGECEVGKKLVTEEEQSTGSISFKVYFDYVKSLLPSKPPRQIARFFGQWRGSMYIGYYRSSCKVQGWLKI
jgi:hypothetical protein